MSDDVEQALRDIDARLQEIPLPPALMGRVLRGTRASAVPEVFRVRTFAVVAAVGLVAGIFGHVGASLAEPVGPDLASAAAERMLAISSRARDTIGEPAPWWDGELSASVDCGIIEHTAALEVDEGCRITLTERSTTIDAWSDVVVAPSEDGISILDGSALISVDPDRPPEAGLRVSVPHAAIEVVGTRFAVSVTADGGQVDLLEGSIALTHAARGEKAPVLVVPGHRVQWSSSGVERSAVPELATPPERPVARRALRDARRGEPHERRHDRDALDAALDEVSRLRVQGDWSGALETLRSARRNVADERVAEVLSFEEGTLREKLDHAEEACAYWRGHIARFPEGHYRAAVERRVESCQRG